MLIIQALDHYQQSAYQCLVPVGWVVEREWDYWPVEREWDCWPVERDCWVVHVLYVERCSTHVQYKIDSGSF